MELVVAMAIMSVVLGSISAAMFITVQALPDGKSAADVAASEFNALEQFATELTYALHFTERSATTVAFTVADRDNDGVPERIRYAWSGSPGDALTRAYNGGTAADFLADVSEFDLVFQVKQVTEEYPGPLVEGPEVVLHSHGTVNGTANGFSIKRDDWPGQYFSPTLPADAASWSITRALLFARRDGAGSGETLVQLRTADQNNLPTSTIIEAQSMWESLLGSSFGWYELVYNDVSGLDPGQGLCLVAKHNAGGTAAVIMYDNGGGSGAFNTHDAGGSWSYFDSIERLHYIYGKIIAPGPTQTATRGYVTAVSVALRSGDDSASRLMTTVQTLNYPEALLALWETGFDIDPLVDLNGDGQADWVVGIGNHDADSVSNGVWDADARLDTSPEFDFTHLTTASVRFRDTSIGAGGVVFRINADNTGTTVSPIVVRLKLETDVTQTLTIFGVDDAGSVIFDTLTGLDSGWVTLRLLIDPVLDTVCLMVDSAYVGTYEYPSRNAGGLNRVAMLNRSPTAAEFDYVSIRVSE